MNNDPPSSDLPSSELLPALDQAADAHTTATSTGEDGPSEDASVSTQRGAEPSPAQKRAQAQTKKKYEFVNHLTLNLDILIYAELSILYYMEFVPFPSCPSQRTANALPAVPSSGSSSARSAK